MRIILKFLVKTRMILKPVLCHHCCAIHCCATIAMTPVLRRYYCATSTVPQFHHCCDTTAVPPVLCHHYCDYCTTTTVPLLLCQCFITILLCQCFINILLCHQYATTAVPPLPC